MNNLLEKNKQLILFDGICNLCNSSVLTIIKSDKKDIFRFVSLQSEIGKNFISYLGINSKKTDSIILYIPNEAYYIKSTAVLKIMNEFGGFWKLTQGFFVFPEGFRNFIYDFIAKNRYKWFGKKDTCMLPSKELKAKFL